LKQFVGSAIIVAVLLAGVQAAAAAAPSRVSAAADTVRDCPGNRRLGHTIVYYGDLSVRNMACASGRRALRRARLRNGGVAVPGWSCRMIGTYSDGGIFRCTRGGKAMRFKAGG
jgi:hypothetical protein